MKISTITLFTALSFAGVSSLFAQAAPPRRYGAAVQVATPPHIAAAILVAKPEAVPSVSDKSSPPKAVAVDKFPWKHEIVTTVFWIGEDAHGNNPVPNHASSWDKAWGKSYGGFDDPNPAHRRGFAPAKFTPHQNPFYCALPYNDKASTGHRPEAPRVVPWFKEAYQGPAMSVCKGRWLAIKKGGKTVYAQWEDAGPFRTDHWQYVFGNERPKPNLNKGAGLDVSPAVRDFLTLKDTDVTDWKFVDFSEVPRGPWSTYGDNNPFVTNDRIAASTIAQAKPTRSASTR